MHGRPKTNCEEVELDTWATSRTKDELTPPTIPDRHFFFSSNVDNDRKSNSIEMTTLTPEAPQLNQVPMGEGVYHQFPPYREKKLTEHVAESLEAATQQIDKAADKVAGLVSGCMRPKG